MAEPKTLAASHSAEVWTAFCGSVTIIGVLVTVLYNNAIKSIKNNSERLDNGQKEFEKLKIEQGKINEHIDGIDADIDAVNKELDRIDTGQRDTDKRFERLLSEHDNCIPRRIAMRGKSVMEDV